MSPGTRRTLELTLRLAAAALVIAGAIWFALHYDLRKVGAALRHASPPLVLAAAALNFVGVLWRSARVAALLAPIRRVSTLRLFRYNVSCFAVSNMLPARAGDALRVYLLSVREGVPWASGVSMSLVEKLFELLTMLVIVLPVPWLVPGMPPSVATTIETLAAGALVALVAAAALARAGKGDGFVARFAEGAKVMRAPRTFALAGAFSLLVWLTDAGMVWLVLRAVGIEAPWATPLLVLLGVNVAIAVPSTPGQIGVLEAGAVVALGLIHVPEEKALAFALLYHAVQVVPITLAGLPGLRLLAEARAHVGQPAAESLVASPGEGNG